MNNSEVPLVRFNNQLIIPEWKKCDKTYKTDNMPDPIMETHIAISFRSEYALPSILDRNDCFLIILLNVAKIIHFYYFPLSGNYHHVATEGHRLVFHCRCPEDCLSRKVRSSQSHL